MSESTIAIGVNLIFWVSLAVAAGMTLIYFRDSGDISQFIFRIKRENVIRAIRNEYLILSVGLGATALMLLTHLIFGVGPGWIFWPILLVIAVLNAYTWAWGHLVLDGQPDSAKYYSIAEAKEYLSPTSSVIVIENNGVARAHPDSQIVRPHLAGNSEGLGGEDVVMTYCGMSNLGIAYKPEIEGKRLDLEVVAQYGNNLIMRDMATNEPIQHIYGSLEKDRGSKTGPVMEAWPSFRMTFRGFQKAYPEGKVFLNKPSGNRFYALLNVIPTLIFTAGIVKQNVEAKPLMDNMTHYDDRLPNKTYVWGIDIGEDAVCYTDDFLGEHDGPVNANIGGRDIVIDYDSKYESVGAWYNDTGLPIARVDFFGNSDRGKLERVEKLKSGMFWHVWVNFFPHTEIDRVTEPLEVAVGEQKNGSQAAKEVKVK